MGANACRQPTKEEAIKVGTDSQNGQKWKELQETLPDNHTSPICSLSPGCCSEPDPETLGSCDAGSGGGWGCGSVGAICVAEPAEPIAYYDDDGEDDTLQAPPLQGNRRRRGAVCAEPMYKGFFREPYWNKLSFWERDLYKGLQSCRTFEQFSPQELEAFVKSMEIHKRHSGELFDEAGNLGDGLFVVLSGQILCYRGDELVGRAAPGSVLDEAQVLYPYPRKYSLGCQEECIAGKLRRTDYVDLCTRCHFYKRELRQFHLKNSKLLEMMEDEQIAKLGDCLELRTYEASTHIIQQGDEGAELFVLEEGEAKVWKRVGDDIQEYVTYVGGELFGEIALVKNAPRAANVTATKRCEVLVLSRAVFERLFGPMSSLQAEQYLSDPRKLIADFYELSDARGPRGTLRQQNLEPDPETYGGESAWFVVYRPTSRDAIAKMLSGAAVGKGLNVKGKSAKKGVLSGYVPFVQVSDNKHKPLIETWKTLSSWLEISRTVLLLVIGDQPITKFLNQLKAKSPK